MRLLLFIAVFLCCAACSDEDRGPADLSGDYRVDVLFAPMSLGDGGYCDMILYGMQQASRKHGFRLDLHCPLSDADGWQVYKDWLKEAEGKGKEGKRLFVFASHIYEERLRKAIPRLEDSRSVMLFETEREVENVRSFRLEMYGAAYCMGRLAAQLSRAAALMPANPEDRALEPCIEGFREGYLEEDAGRMFGVHYLTDKTGEGYNMPDSAYRASKVLYQDYDFVFPLAGGSNLGVFQHTRENPKGIYTAGVDVDMSAWSTQVLASLTKRMDLALEDQLAAWMKGEKMAGTVCYGMDSGLVKVSVNKEYTDFFAPLLPGLEEAGQKNPYILC